MPISALSESTLRQLSSTATITSPVAVVKELVENALDAGSSSIEAHVSANTVDKIEVRDNGSGISPPDFESIGRRGYTSKIRDLGDVSVVGGTSLGFRGMALWSICSVSRVVLTTRTEGDICATSMVLTAGGGTTEHHHRSGTSRELESTA